MFKMATIDLDGTLLGPDGRIGERNRRAVEALTAAGIHPVIATGRMQATSLPSHRELGLSTPVISYNGAMVTDPGANEVWLNLPLEADLAADIVRWGARENLHLNYYLNDTLYVARETRWSELYHARTGSIIHPVGSLERFAGERPTKIILVDEPEATRHWEEQWRRREGERAYLVRTAVEYLEFLRPEANKWSAARVVAARLGVRDEDVVAFGDSLNDIPMLRGAGLGVAMPYAPQEALEAAHVTGVGGPEDAFGATVEKLLAGGYTSFS